MALTDDEQATLGRLQNRLNRDLRGYRVDRHRRRMGFESLDAYYDGEQRLVQLGLAVPAELREFVTIVAWPGTQVDSIVDRRTVEGFRLAGQPKADAGLWAIWQANDLDTESPLARVDTNVFGRSYYCVGTNEDDADNPLITVESPMQMTHEWSNRKRRVTTAARFYTDDDGPKKTRRATWYGDGVTHWLVKGKNGWEDEQAPDEHGLPCPVVPSVNRARPHARYGMSQMGRIITLTDAAARALTLAQVGTEVMGLPQRTAAGLSQEDFKDPKTGEMLTTWEAYFGAVWATKNPEARFHQFTAADLSNFSEIVSHYAQLVAGITGLPMRYLGQLSDNPPSADGIRADESRLVKIAENQNVAEAGALEKVMRLAQWIKTGADDPKLAGMETIHRDPSTPTWAQAADASVKLATSKPPIISVQQAQRDLGYTQIQMNQIEDDFKAARTDPTLQSIIDDALKTRGGGTGGDNPAAGAGAA